MTEVDAFRHCDDYIDDPKEPEVLRKFLERARSPAHGRTSPDPYPKLFADYEGQTYRVTMASRFGDVGITKDLTEEYGNQKRVAVAHLTNFREKP